MQKKFTFWHIWIVITYCLGTMAWALPDALFSAATNKLTIPYVSYQGRSYQAELIFEAPDKLTLQQLIPNTGEAEAGRIVPVYADLSFHLAQLRANGENYQADVSFEKDRSFKVLQLSAALFTPVAPAEVSSKHFSGSGNCQGCHNGIKDNTGKDVSIIAAWQPTMMANAARDPFWKAQVKNELTRTPSQSALINERCSRCHAPMANVEAKKQNTTYPIFGEGLLNPEHTAFALAQEGVSCSLCHQIKSSATLGTLAGSSGNFEIDSYDNPTDRKIYGPFENVMTSPMQQFVKFTPTFSPHIKASEHCASCHDLKTPYTDEAGTPLSNDKASEFPEQMAYSEWKHSDFSKTQTCQQCHMKRANGVIIASQIPMLTTKRDDFAQHRLVGGNKLMLTMLQDYSAALGVNAKDFSAVLAETEELMRGAATLTIINPDINAEALQFTLNLTSKTGHKLPSSYPSRRVIVHVVIKDQNQAIVFESGKVNSDGSVINLDADMDKTKAESHYDLITSQDQVQVYEDIMEDYKGNITYTLLRAKKYRKDNRLLPPGFNKAIAPADIQVVGEALNDTNFIGGSDEIHFKLAGLTGKSYTIDVELIYQTLGYAFAQDMFTNAAPEVSQFKQMFNASKLKSYPITQATITVTR
ncbi:MAG: multiheme c-type cytochrome [Methylococcales bacterium]